MKRTLLTTVSAVVALAAAPLAAQETNVEANSGAPSVSEAGTGTAVSSGEAAEYDTNSPEISSGDAPVDDMPKSVTAMEAEFLEAAKGSDLETMDGEKIGVIEDVNYNAQGHPELWVDIVDASKIRAEKLVITAQGDAVYMSNGRVVLETDKEELFLKAASALVDDSNQTAQISLM
jgi:hypothetical protein